MTETTQTPAADGGAAEPAYDVHAVQERWLEVWDRLQPFRSGQPGDDRPKKYVLDMFPYPSGDLHMGHAEAYALGDVPARYWIQRGYDVMHPIGWDAFGLPAENAAIKRGADPKKWTYENIAVQKASMRRYACSFDWDRVLNTCDPEFYTWNQWLFLRLFERGLAYRKSSSVNWCPKDQTVLANEQVVGGLCERCDTPVTKKKLTQWYFKITDYADRLLDDMAGLEGHWPDRVLSMQRNWIGRSTGAEVEFRDRGSRDTGDGLHHAAGHAVRRDLLRGGGRLRPGGRAGCGDRGGGRVRDLPGAGQGHDRDPAAVHRRGEDRRLPAPLCHQPRQRRPAAGVGR